MSYSNFCERVFDPKPSFGSLWQLGAQRQRPPSYELAGEDAPN